MNKQPLPSPGRDSVFKSVIQDLLARELKGIATYGRTLETHNGRDAMLDLYEELLDAAVYIKQVIMERDNAPA